MKSVTLLLFSLLSAAYCINRNPHEFFLSNVERDSMSTAINDVREFVIHTRLELQNISVDENIKSRADNMLEIVLKRIKYGPMMWLDIAEKFSELREIVEAIPEIVRSITIGQQNYGFSVEMALEIVNNTREVVNDLTKHLKDKVSGETRKLMDIGEAVKNIVNANPSNFTMDLALSEESARDLALEVYEAPRQLNDFIEKICLQTVEQFWCADIAIDSLEFAFPLKTIRLKSILYEVETMVYFLRRETKKLLTTVEWQINTNSSDTEQPPHDSSDVILDMTDTILRLGGILTNGSTEFVVHIGNAVERMTFQISEGIFLEDIVQIAMGKFAELERSTNVVIEKIQLDKRNNIISEDTLELYTDMFGRVLKEKLKPFINDWNDLNDVTEATLSEFPPELDGHKACLEEFKTQINEMGTIGNFIYECGEHFDYNSPIEEGAHEFYQNY